MFKFKGIRSTEMNVIVEEEEELIARASIRYETTEIEGKDGAEFNELGYSCVERNIVLQCLDTNKIDSILSWLTGEGELEYKDRKTTARFYVSLEPKRRACIRIIEANLIRNPFWNKKYDDFITITDHVENEGNIASRPIIRLEKGTENSVEIEINGVRFIYNFPPLENYVEIDCNDKTILYEGFNRSRNLEIDYEFPLLNVGMNNVYAYSGDATIKIKRKDRWL